MSEELTALQFYESLGELTDIFSRDEIKGREQIFAFCGKLAEFVIGKGNIESIGITGSIADGKENPSDIDLVFFVKEGGEKALEAVKKNGEYTPSSLRFIYFVDCLGIEDSNTKHFIQYALGQPKFFQRPPVDIFVVNGHITKEYARSVGETYFVDFLDNLNRRTLIYDPRTKTFIKKSPFSLEDQKIIEETKFEMIKKTMGDDEKLDRITEEVQKRGRKKEKVKKEVI